MKYSFFFLALVFFCSSCGIYKFSGASVSPEVKTVAISVFENNARLVVPNLSQKLTEALKTQVINGTSLSYVREPSMADIIFEGTVTDYTVQPVAISGGAGQSAQTTSQQSRLTITVNIKFTNVKENKNWESSFSDYSDFDNARQTLQQVEQSLIDDINKRLIQKIFNKAFVDW